MICVEALFEFAPRIVTSVALAASAADKSLKTDVRRGLRRR